MFQRGQLRKRDRLCVVGLQILHHQLQPLRCPRLMRVTAQKLRQQKFYAIFQHILRRIRPAGLAVEIGKQPSEQIIMIPDLDRFFQLQLRQLDPQTDDLPLPGSAGLLLMLPARGIDDRIQNPGAEPLSGNINPAAALGKIQQFKIRVRMPAVVPLAALVGELRAEAQFWAAGLNDLQFFFVIHPLALLFCAFLLFIIFPPPRQVPPQPAVHNRIPFVRFCECALSLPCAKLVLSNPGGDALWTIPLFCRCPAASVFLF